jgi:hypothetical protein
MNPFSTTTDLGKALQRYALYAPLVMLDSTLTPRPWLAASWDTVAVGADTLALTFRSAATCSGRMAPRRPPTMWRRRSATPSIRARRSSMPRRSDSTRPRRGPRFLHRPLPAARHPTSSKRSSCCRRCPRTGWATRRRRKWRATRWAAPSGQRPVPLRAPLAAGVGVRGEPDLPGGARRTAAAGSLVYRTVPEQTSLITEVLTGRIDLAVSIRPPQVERLLASGTCASRASPCRTGSSSHSTPGCRLPQQDVRRAMRWPSTGATWWMASWAATTRSGAHR